MTNENIINHIHTLLWEYTANYVETSEDSKTKLYTIAVENNFSRYVQTAAIPLNSLISRNVMILTSRITRLSEIGLLFRLR